MKLTEAILASYVGGQMAVLNKVPGKVICTHRGEIIIISLDEKFLRLILAWYASSSPFSWNIVGYGTERRKTWECLRPEGRQETSGEENAFSSNPKCSARKSFSIRATAKNLTPEWSKALIHCWRTGKGKDDNMSKITRQAMEVPYACFLFL
ncbi:MAG TPA: hypothetical protein VMV71_01040 [Candidatus Paceibacterota bacterium]|nr:hypothetical protein [Candidatus Paceibacterota bacterium]